MVARYQERNFYEVDFLYIYPLVLSDLSAPYFRPLLVSR